MDNQIISEYLSLTESTSFNNCNNSYDDQWDESNWSDEPKAGCWGDW